jgi:hypothetical protein
MTDETANLILEHMRYIRARVDAIFMDVEDLKVRMTANEMQVAAMGRRLDRMDERLGRIERRLELVES